MNSDFAGAELPEASGSRMSDLASPIPQPAFDYQDALESRIQKLEADQYVCLNELARVESAFAAAAAALQNELAALREAVIEPAGPHIGIGDGRTEETEAPEFYREAWQAAPLTLRLRFVRDLLPADHPCHPLLKDAAELEELRRKGGDLEQWILRYPSLFADAMAGLNGAISEPTTATERLAYEVAQQARHALDANLTAIGLARVDPEPGGGITGEHEVIGEEAGRGPAGRVARVIRAGFRLGGRLLLPAQVVRTAVGEAPPSAAIPDHMAFVEPPILAISDGEAPVTAEAAEPREPAVDAAQADAQRSGTPDWLRTLQQRCLSCTVPAVTALLERLERLPALADEARAGTLALSRVWDAIGPLLPVLTARHASAVGELPEEWGALVIESQPGLVEWLRTALNTVLVSPAVGDLFDPAVMEPAGTRSTVHAHEDGTVARVESSGLVVAGTPLLRARVQRYDRGGER